MRKIIGFTAGAFDMFHVGHLNLIKNARARCDYLIVGVNTDQLIEKYKKKKVIVPLQERLQIVESIRYVDEAISVETLNKERIWMEKKFDVVFIGDDWKGSQRWNETEEIMQRHGVKVVYLPYTRGTTSTLLREKLIEL